MSLATVNVNEQLRSIAQIVRGCPTLTLRRAYTRALRDWCGQTQWLRMNVPGAAVAGTREYNLGNDPQLDICGIFAMQGQQDQGTGIQYWPIRPSDSSRWDPNSNTGQPLRFQYVPEAQFALDPIPDQDYTLLITIIVQPKEAAVNIPSAPLVKYSNEIEAGALGYLYGVPGQPWTDQQEMLRQLAIFQAGVANGKAEAQRAYSIGAQRATPRQFVFPMRGGWNGL